MYMIGIRLIRFKQVEPGAAMAKWHSERKADLCLRQILAQTIPGTCIALAKLV